MDKRDTSPAVRAGLVGKNEWLKAVVDQRVSPRPHPPDVRAIVFTAGAAAALRRWKHAEMTLHPRVRDYRSARTLLAERMRTTDAVLQSYLHGERQIEQLLFDQAMQIELFGKPIICLVPRYLLLYADRAGIMSDELEHLVMSNRHGRVQGSTDVGDVASAIHEAHRLANFLADAQQRGHLRGYGSADWQSVLKAMRPARSRREIVRRALVEHTVLTNAEARQILAETGHPSTALQVAQTFSSLKSHKIAETVRHGVHRLAGSTTAQAGGLMVRPLSGGSAALADR